jgi:hypothetical protein
MKRVLGDRSEGVQRRQGSTDFLICLIDPPNPSIVMARRNRAIHAVQAARQDHRLFGILNRKKYL